MTIISIHQPGYHPWLGFFKKILDSDIFVLLDDAQYEKKQWHNRNKIRTSNGSSWISVPVKSQFGSNLNEVKIDSSIDWKKLHMKSISLNYSRARYFKQYFNHLEKIYQKEYDFLIDINMEIIKFLLKELQIKTKTIFSSELNTLEKGSNRILEICKKLDADMYISGILGKNYISIDDFQNNNISVRFQEFQHPIYQQCFEPFIPNMSAIDLLFNEGGNHAHDVLQNSKD